MLKTSLKLAAAVAIAISISACGGSGGGSCSSAEDVAKKVSQLSTDMQKAVTENKLDTTKAADVATRMQTAGTNYAANQDHKAYCEELDKVRADFGL